MVIEATSSAWKCLIVVHSLFASLGKSLKGKYVIINSNFSTKVEMLDFDKICFLKIVVL
jgi:hypothetical protein